MPLQNRRECKRRLGRYCQQRSRRQPPRRYCTAWSGCLLVASFALWPTYSAVAVAPLQPLAPSPAFDFSGGVEWLNTANPISLKDLRGKIVLLDFWTYCCINCLQTLPDLQQLEQAYPKELVVIGIHAPKFFGERDTTNIREAILRHGIRHPVLNDANAVVAKRYGVPGWPALRVIDPAGMLIAQHDGEATFDMLNQFMRRTVARYRRQGTLDEAPLRFELEQYQAEATPLRFPGKILADAESARLFIADSAHHRIVVSSLQGELLATIGNGSRGRTDGDLATATFSNPQGMALRGDTLIIADTDNHLLRAADLKRRIVTTIAGTGKQAHEVLLRASRQPTRMRLASPWDLCLRDDDLYIAMAGIHQICRFDLTRNVLHPFAGNGIEDIVNGPALARAAYQPGSASFAQPSGLATDGQRLYVADSEGSSIRVLPFGRSVRVGTILGTAERPPALRLFTYGDRDGPLAQALLQHPLAVAVWQNRLFVADTYNNKIKEIDLRQGIIRTVAGDAQPGQDDEPARFNEPAGLSIARDKLYVADTNNHCLRIIELAGDPIVRTLEVRGLEPPATPAIELAIPDNSGIRRSFGTAQVAPNGKSLRLAIRLNLLPGVILNRDVPMSYVVSLDGGDEIVDADVVGKRVEVADTAPQFELDLPLVRRSGSSELRITLSYFYCQDSTRGLCKIGNVIWTGEVELSPTGSQRSLELEHTIR